MEGNYDVISTRDAFGNALSEKADEYKNLFYLAADTLKSVGGSKMYAKYPERTLNTGISEQTMALAGAGLAESGAKVVLAGYAVFSTLRILEQIRTFICYPNLDVKIVAGLSGLSGAQEGVTHQGIEDIAALRSIPNLAIVSPADAASTEVITRAIIDYQGPVYMRLGRSPYLKVFDESYRFQFGKANLLRSYGNDATLIVSGLVTANALAAAEILHKQKYDIRVFEMPCIKPLDKETVLSAAKDSGMVLTLEDHQITGGLGTAVAEVLAENGIGKLHRIGIRDVFTESGDYEELLEKYGLSAKRVAAEIKNVLDANQRKDVKNG